MKDSDLMPWGAHKKKPIGEVPFDYLYKLYRKMWLSGDVLLYFEKQLRILEESEACMGETPGGKKPKKYIIENYECCYPTKEKVL